MNAPDDQGQNTLSPDDDFMRRLREASPAEFLDMLRAANPQQALTVAQTLEPQALYDLPRDVVEGWEGGPLVAGTARNIRQQRLLAWREGRAHWRIADIARAVGVRNDAVGRWRTNGYNNDPNWTRCLPFHDDSNGPVKRVASETHPGGIPLWFPSTALPWLLATGRITDDLYPHDRARAGRIPPGRPPKQRTPAE